MNIKKIVGIGLIVGLLVLGAWGVIARQKDAARQGGKLLVAATYYPLYEYARAVGGDRVEVRNLTPSGSEPHDYEPSPKQIADALSARVFIYNGGSLEPWVDTFLADYKQMVVASAQGIDLQTTANENASKRIVDPHFWLDPNLARQIVDNIQKGLSKADPASRTYFEGRAQAYKAKLAELDENFRHGLANCQTRTLVTSHQAFGYLAKRYNLDVESIAGLEPEAEPSPARLAELAKIVRDKGLKYVFFESLVSPRLAETLAKETGAKTAVFDPIEGISNADQQQGKNYLSIQRENLAALRTALACQ